MEDEYIKTLMRRHEAHKKATLNYYYKNRESIAEQRKQKWREDHPNPKPRGRPKKVVEVGSSESV